MRSWGTKLGLLAMSAAAMALVAASATAVGPKKLVEGTVYDTTCATSCSICPPPPHCGPVTAQSSGDIVCAQPQRAIACPLAGPDRAPASPDFCLQGQPCGVDYPVYSGEGAVVNVRRRGSTTVLATLPIVEGQFKLRLGAGNYVFHPYLPEPQCWSGEPVTAKVTAKMNSPVLTPLYVSDSCVAHPGTGSG